jgi:hypothetical protein
MLLIFGFRVRFKTTGTIAFFCPRCGGDRHGNTRVARRWFTLMFLPIIPLNTVGEVVECTTCHGRFSPGVTAQPTTAALGQVLANAVRVLTALIVRSGDATDPAMRAAAVADVRSAAGTYDEATLDSDMASIDPATAEQYVTPLADGLAVAGKERLIADLTRVALAGGTVTANQRQVIDLVGRGVGLTPAHITGIVSSVAAARTPGAPGPGSGSGSGFGGGPAMPGPLTFGDPAAEGPDGLPPT